MQLIPKEVTIEGSFKTFGLDKGRSDGTTVSMTFTVPEGMSIGELRMAMLKEKCKVDVLCFTAEALKGTIAAPLYEKLKGDLTKAYDKLVTPVAPVEGLPKKSTSVVSDLQGAETTAPVTPMVEPAKSTKTTDLDIDDL